MSKENTNAYLFEEAPIKKAVSKLAVPTIISSLVMVIYNMADTYFVGLLNDPIQTAGVTLAGPALLAFFAGSNLFGVGTSSAMSRALGRKRYDEVRQSSAVGFYGSVASGILLSALCLVFYPFLMKILGASGETLGSTKAYMDWAVAAGAAPSILNVVFSYLVRSEGEALSASIGTMSGALLNIVLDPIFILPWGFNMGAAGAGLATFLSNCVACLYFFFYVWRKRGKTFVSIQPKDFTLSPYILGEIANVGVPASVQNLLNVTGMTILNNFTAGYGPDAVAAMGIALKLQLVPIQVALGATQGVMPLISYTFANGRYDRMKDSILFVTKRVIIAMVAVTAVSVLAARPMVGFFMENPNVISYGEGFLRGLMLALPFMIVDFMAVSVFQSVGDGRKALVFAILRKIIFEIPFIIILNILFPPFGLSFAQFVAEFVLSIIAVVLLRKFFRSLKER